MQFKRPTRKQRPESVVPMINVVFLLLIFFLMSASIVTPPPFDVTLPRADSIAELSADITLYIARDSMISAMGLQGDAAWQGLTQAAPTKISIRADQDVSASDVAAIISRLSALGVAQIDLAVAAP